MDEERDPFVYELKGTKDGRNIDKEIKKKKKEERMEIRLKDHLWTMVNHKRIVNFTDQSKY